ncbi:MAG: thioredoxin family protein [Pseudomonadota bacterium]
MNKRLTAGFLLGGVMAAALAHAAVTVDTPAPDFTLQDVNGNDVTLSDYAGQYVVLEWTNHDCPYVRKHYESGNMQGLQSRYTEQDVVWLSIISSAPGKQGYVESAEAIELTESRNASPTTVLHDPDGVVGRTYGARTTPHMYIIDPEGTLRYAGAIDSIKSARQSDIPKATNYVDAAMSALLAGDEVEEKLTSPYGCSVKYSAT